MRNLPVLRWLLMGLLSLVLFAIGLVLVPLIYPIRKWVRYYEVKPFWWLLNNSLPEVKGDIDYGDYGRFKHTFIGFYKQNALRNPYHNLKVKYLKPKQGIKRNVKGELMLLSVDSNYEVGNTKGTYTIKGTKYFRRSMIWEFCTRYFHYQIGFENHKYLYKFKTGKV